ncbi:MAG TPA: DUF5698 domain-containing protein [Anaerolineales bacterium]|nr:DUF5698 domain-containing protein [Anaerolineales bacterium]
MSLDLINPAWLPLVIFLLRVVDMSLDTLRVLFVVRGRRAAVWFLGFSQSLIWVTAITVVLAHLDNPWNVLGYAAGFASGTLLGMLIEDRLALGHGHVRVISTQQGPAVAQALRQAGHAVTELTGRGRDGAVSVLSTSVRRREIDPLLRLITSLDPAAFVTVEEIRPLGRGHWRS